MAGTKLFRYEREMCGPARQWLLAEGLMVKVEFGTPWGVCDLVGCSLDAYEVRRRLLLRQRKPIRSEIRVGILLKIPQASSGTTESIEDLCDYYGPYLDRKRIVLELGRLVRDRYIEEDEPGRYHRRTPWMPIHKRLVAVELKLDRVADVICQATNHLGLFDESYIGLPEDVADRLMARWRTGEFLDRGLGVLSVSPDGCHVIAPARRRAARERNALQVAAVERFWSAREAEKGQ